MSDWYIPQERLNQFYPFIRKYLDENGYEKTLLLQDNYMQQLLEYVLIRLQKLEQKEIE